MRYSFFPVACGVLAASLTLTTVTLAQRESDTSSNHTNATDLMSFPKNQARHHLGSTLLEYDLASATYTSSKASSAWLDDDETTGWTPSTGKSYFLLVLPEPKLLTTFTLSAPGTSGTISLFAGDEKAAPEATSWTPVARNLNIEEINEKLLSGTFNRYGRYLLVETNITATSPWWSLYLFGREPAITYRIEKRLQPVSATSILGPEINTETLFDTSNLYSSARVSYVSTGGDVTSWQGMIDESPESFWILSGVPTSGPDVVVDLATGSPIQRISTLVSASSGVMEFFVVNDIAPEGGISAIDLDKMTPVCALGFDGVSDRESLNFPPVTGKYLLVRWIPTTEGDFLKVHQIDTFSDIQFEEYAVISDPDKVAMFDPSKSKVVLGKDVKTLLDPIAEGPGEDPTLRGPLPPPLLTPPLLITATPTPTPTPPRNDPQSP